MTLAAAGLAIGMAGALALTRLLESQLFGISAHDPVTYTVTPLVLAPGRRAGHPATVLRLE